MGGGTVEISTAHAGEKLRLFLFETVFLARTGNAFERYLKRHVQQQGQVRAQAALHPVFQHFDVRRRNTAPAALISEGGIGKTVGNNVDAFIQSRQYHVFQMLAAGGEHQQGFGTQSDAAVGRQQQAAQFLAQRRAARLAGEQNRHSAPFKPFAYGRQMGGFARTVDAVECQKLCLHGCASLNGFAFFRRPIRRFCFLLLLFGFQRPSEQDKSDSSDWL